MTRAPQSSPRTTAAHRARRLAGSLGAALAVAVALALLAAQPQRALADSFSNSDGPITLPTGSAAVSPYPSTITVSGLSGSIISVTVRVQGLTHSFPDDIDMLLVGPRGQAIVLMSDAGGATPLAGVNLTFSDAAAVRLPDPGPITTGSYKPTNIAAGDAFPAPAPAGPYAAALSAFNLTEANGDWRLFVVEDGGGSSGSIASWSLDIATADLAVGLPGAPATVNAGSNLSYTVRVANAGTDPVSAVTLAAPIPAGTTFQSVTPPAGWTCAPLAVGATGALSCSAASFATGVADFAVVVKVSPSAALGSDVALAASISSATPEANTANNTTAGSTEVTTSADLSVTSVGASATINAGASMAIAVAVSNAGPSDADTPSVTMPVPAGTTFVSVTAPAGWTCDSPAVGAGGAATCSAPVLGLSSASFTLIVKVNPAAAAGQTVDSSATVASQTSDPAAGNNTGSATTTIQTAADMALSLDAAPNPVSAGTRLTYTIVAANNGPSNAAAASVSTTVPVNTVFASLQAPAGWTCTTPAVNDIGAISCTHPSFGVGSATFKLAVLVKLGTPLDTSITLSASAATSTPERAPANNDADVTATVTVSSDVSVTITPSRQSVRPGQQVSYSIRVNNSGPEFASTLALTTAVPAGSTLVSLSAPAGWSCTAPAVGAAGAVSCTNDSMDVTADTLVLTVAVSPTSEDRQLTAAATVQAATPDGAPANNSASAQVAVLARWLVYGPVVTR